MNHVYSISGIATLTPADGDVDWLELFPFIGDNKKRIRLRGFILSQLSRKGNTQEESLRFSILRLTRGLSSGGEGNYEVPPPANDADSPHDAGQITFSPATMTAPGGTVETLAEFAWNVRSSPYEMWWPDSRFAPSVRRVDGLAAALVLRQQNPATSDMTCQITAYVD